MTRIDVILMAMNIIRECEAHNENNGSCTSCPFGTTKGSALYVTVTTYLKSGE